MADQKPDFEGYSCPVPIARYTQVLLAHGGGGKLTHELIEKLFLPEFRNPGLELMHDGAMFSIGAERLAFSTDSYVVHPLFFPGGNIGELAINGTVNDLAMCGARPMYLSSALIIEEGFSMDDLWRVVHSMQQAAQEAGVALVTGDTKVVDRGKGDGLFITTSGIGVIPSGRNVDPRRAVPGDAILVSGPIAQHGIAIMSVREGLQFGTTIRSDTAPLNGLVEAMFSACQDIHVLRDPTRGGVASTLNEIAGQAGVGMTILETEIPVDEEVRGACELLGFDPLYVANEGKLLAIVAREHAEALLAAMRAHPEGSGSAIIGEVTADHPGIVVMKSGIGSSRIVDMLSGEQLPRIC
jgi:hydrogenase expression/formation protein HypE